MNCGLSMIKHRVSLQSFFLCLLISLSIGEVKALDEIKLNKHKKLFNVGGEYRDQVINRLLKITEKEFGPYRLTFSDVATTSERSFFQVKTGHKTNVFVAIPRYNWEDETLAVYIPFRRGILNYRLLAVNNNSIDNFKHVRSEADLKKLKAGVVKRWATTKILKEKGYHLHEADNLEGLYHMLSTNRIDYIPRGVGEIYTELFENIENVSLSNVTVLPDLALYMPVPYYIFVSQSAPNLHKRFSSGMQELVKTRELKHIFDEYYGDDVAKANLSKRHIIKVENLSFSHQTAFKQPDYWFENDK